MKRCYIVYYKFHDMMTQEDEIIMDVAFESYKDAKEYCANTSAKDGISYFIEDIPYYVNGE